ncbi:MAG: PEP-CTERM sorting domain-containing protein [Armatimonadetes bacterium]|nr:PEP-CTERM sorting domain-containing protein [Armatimonadota bacterium]
MKTASPSRFNSLLLASLAMCSSALAVGPTSTLYIMNYGEFAGGNEVGLDRVQGAGEAGSTTGNNLDICPAVWGDVRTMGYADTNSGSRFDLVGSPLVGGPYTNNIPNSQLHDGTTDGTYNYSVNYTTGDVLQFDRNWANPTVLFNPLGPNTTGYITMNVADGSFWLSQFGGSDLVEHRTHAGALISSFNSGVFNEVGLALDPVDGTLWMSVFDGGHTLYQFSQGGAFLQTQSFNLNGTWYGMEFNTNVTPEPATMSALLLGIAAIAKRKKAG